MATLKKKGTGESAFPDRGDAGYKPSAYGTEDADLDLQGAIQKIRMLTGTHAAKPEDVMQQIADIANAQVGGAKAPEEKGAED